MTSYREHSQNLKAIVGSLEYKYDSELKTYTFKWASREDYLEWRTKWRQTYKVLSTIIRSLKGQRKQFKYEYRPKDNNTMKRRTKIGANLNYDGNAFWYVEMYRSKARELMKVRIASKIEAGQQRDLRLKEAA